MTTHHNPALREEPRNQPLMVSPLTSRESLFSWLESTGRFLINDEIDEAQDHKVPEDLEDVLETEVYALESEEEELD
jgi:hypothetical protein